MDTLQQMRAFVRIVESGSFTAAAATLDTTTGAVSRAMAGLEARLRSRLLNRSTRHVAVTPAGELYLERCRRILADIEMAEEEAGNALTRPAGKLRIRSFASVGQHYILPAVGAYRALYPDVAIELALSQRVPELFEGSMDVAVVVTSISLPDSNLVSHLLGVSFSILCASPAYAKAHGLPRQPNQLHDHECLILQTPAFPPHEWVLESDDGVERMKVSGAVTMNVPDSVGVAVREGMGIGILPVYAAIDGLEDGSLVRVLPEYRLQKMKIYALHPSRRYTDARLKTWIEFLRTHLPVVIKRDIAALQKVSAVPDSIAYSDLTGDLTATS